MASEKKRSERVLTFTLERELYAVDIASVREILDMAEITRIPQALEYMRGVVNLRGNAVPVMDLRQRFGMSEIQRTVNTRIIIIEHQEKDGVTLIGALADSVKEVLELDAEHIDPPPRMGTKVSNEYIRGIGKQGDHFIILLDASRVFSLEDVAAIKNIVAMAGDAA